MRLAASVAETMMMKCECQTAYNSYQISRIESVFIREGFNPNHAAHMEVATRNHSTGEAMDLDNARRTEEASQSLAEQAKRDRLVSQTHLHTLIIVMNVKY
jgi:hypothetical protein